ncbi:carbohydrate kinase [Neobacillus sp. NPDC097160]|uniref:carbohydrate kinase family protein n=1 Tax=Neobacillus sp. NPDC097160 TaxID=3364298 RepID=UPI0038171BA8
MGKQGVISLGEAFVDFISKDSTNTEYQQLLGGATVNVAVGTRRLGIPTAYLCKLGTDETNQFVEAGLSKERINTEFSVRTASKKICGVYVHINDCGDRYFHSYLNQTPDEVLTEDELSREVFEQSRIFYYGSGTLFHEKAKKTTETALIYAKNSQNIIAFDANIRLKRWESEEQCRKTVSSFIRSADIVKLAEDELNFLTETNSFEIGIEKLSQYRIPFLFVTMGRKGAFAVMNGDKVFVPAMIVEAIDTTGAGDAFMSALLYCFHEKGLPTKMSQLIAYLKFANNVGAAATTKIGSLSAIFDLAELKRQFQNTFN